MLALAFCIVYVAINKINAQEIWEWEMTDTDRQCIVDVHNAMRSGAATQGGAANMNELLWVFTYLLCYVYLLCMFTTIIGSNVGKSIGNDYKSTMQS